MAEQDTFQCLICDKHVKICEALEFLFDAQLCMKHWLECVKAYNEHLRNGGDKTWRRKCSGT